MSTQDELARMRQLMTYGTAQKKSTSAVVEGVRKGADGKSYAVIREGAYYYLEVSNKTGDNLLKEDFDYVGGFRERGKVRYNSHTDAVKNLDMKLLSIQEAYNAKGTVISSADGLRKTVLVTEAAGDFRKLIERQREIMLNVQHITEGYTVKPKGEGMGKPGSSEPFDASKAEENSGGDTYKEDAKEDPLNDKGEPVEGIRTDGKNDLKEVPGAKEGVKPGMKPVMKEGVDYDVEDPLASTEGADLTPTGEEPVLDPATASEEPVDPIAEPDAAPAEPAAEPAPAASATLVSKLDDILNALDTLIDQKDGDKYEDDKLFPEDGKEGDGEGAEGEPSAEPEPEGEPEPSAEPDAEPADEGGEDKKPFDMEESIRRNMIAVLREMNESGAPFDGSAAKPAESAEMKTVEPGTEAPKIENEEDVIDLTHGDY